MHIVRVADKHIEIYDESTQTVKFRLDFESFRHSLECADNCDSVSAYELAQSMCEELNQNRKQGNTL